MKQLLTLLVIALGLVQCTDKNEKTISGEISIGKKDSLQSAILNEKRMVWVHVPEGASTFEKKKYPVIYLLDGPGHFYAVVGMMNSLSGNTFMPEMIVVAIPNTDRSRDLTPTHVDIDFFSGDSIQYNSGGGGKFLDFIQNELVPYIDKNYPTTSYRTFIGHSFGGLSVIHALTTRPQLFNNYIAIDPSLWWDNTAYMQYADSVLSVNQYEGRSLFVGVANTMPEAMTLAELEKDTSKNTAHIKSILKFSHLQEVKKANGLKFAWRYYPDDDHGSVPFIAEYDAFRSIFSWYRLRGMDDFFDPDSKATADEFIQVITDHYINVSKQLGYTELPGEEWVNSAGYYFLGEKMFDKARALFDLNIKNYPNSYNVYDSRADCYLAEKDSAHALEYYAKSLAINPGSISQKKYDDLKEKLKK